ncbi:unnamed protein product [Heligmosomoides polygyrus]|uniref:Uncharacterized protein n=1 Tax=Heligmosomoides polygyrus TaxID=6339 RepID=A0A183GAL1_HELPZ|nr:unnamed protein product [Heligmosomoides polygyrus]
MFSHKMGPGEIEEGGLREVSRMIAISTSKRGPTADTPMQCPAHVLRDVKWSTLL